jgi:hypothetical protein
VLDCHPEGVQGLPLRLAGHAGEVRSVGEHELEFTDTPPEAK